MLRQSMPEVSHAARICSTFSRARRRLPFTKSIFVTGNSAIKEGVGLRDAIMMSIYCYTTTKLRKKEKKKARFVKKACFTSRERLLIWLYCNEQVCALCLRFFVLVNLQEHQKPDLHSMMLKQNKVLLYISQYRYFLQTNIVQYY